jgi:hypothetical protein
MKFTRAEAISVFPPGVVDGAKNEFLNASKLVQLFGNLLACSVFEDQSKRRLSNEAYIVGAILVCDIRLVPSWIASVRAGS